MPATTSVFTTVSTMRGKQLQKSELLKDAFMPGASGGAKLHPWRPPPLNQTHTARLSLIVF